MKIIDRHSKSNGQGHGSHWLRPSKRLAIYLRDGLACCYCCEAVEDDVKLTLDHLVPHSKGGTNEASNLVTACLRCNAGRGARSWRVFAGRVAGYLNGGVTAEAIIGHILTTRRRKIDVHAAKELIARRGSFAAAVAR